MSEIDFGVSLYSYGGDFLVAMTLEDCLADVADMGATGVEILADTHIPGYPSPSAAWVDGWHGLLDGYGLTPTCYSSWLDTRLNKRRALMPDEARTILLRDLELAHRLGFTIVRPKIGVVSLDLIPDPIWREAVESVLPKAAEYGIRIAPEIHAPTPLKSKIVDDYVDLAHESEHFGLLIDTGIFQNAERGSTHSDSVFRFGNPDPQLAARVAREMSKPMNEDPADLVDLLPYVFHVHAKFWDMTDELADPHVPYDAIVKALVEGGYQGSLSSEYEGPRDLYRASDMVRRQQAMLRRLVAQHAAAGAATS
jgi:sugar phosphate isomerase/epimerase